MTMKEKYEPQLQQLQADVLIRLKAANDKLMEKQQEHEDCLQRIRDLMETERTARGKILEVARALITMYFKRTETPEEMEEVIRPCNMYVAAAGALPLEKETLADLGKQKAQAQESQFKERELLMAVEMILNSLPEEE